MLARSNESPNSICFDSLLCFLLGQLDPVDRGPVSLLRLPRLLSVVPLLLRAMKDGTGEVKVVCIMSFIRTRHLERPIVPVIIVRGRVGGGHPKDTLSEVSAA